MISSPHPSKHMRISRGHVGVCDSAITLRRSGRTEIPTPMERVSWWACTHADPIRNGITSDSHSPWARWQSSQAHASFGKHGISWAKESCEFHRGEISFWNTGSLSASQHTGTHLDAHVNHLQIHTVHTQAPLCRWCERELGTLSGPWTFLSTQTAPQEMERGAALSPTANAVCPPHPPHVKSSLFQPAPHLPAHRSLKPS